MAQIPPYNGTAVEISQRAQEDEAQKKSRGGEFSDNPPSVTLPASIRLMSSQPHEQVPVTGEVPSVNPVDTPREAKAGRTINPDTVRFDEESINEAKGGKPEAPNVIATDSTQVVTSHNPDDPDYRP